MVNSIKIETHTGNVNIPGSDKLTTVSTASLKRKRITQSTGTCIIVKIKYIYIVTISITDG